MKLKKVRVARETPKSGQQVTSSEAEMIGLIASRHYNRPALAVIACSSKSDLLNVQKSKWKNQSWPTFDTYQLIFLKVEPRFITEAFSRVRYLFGIFTFGAEQIQVGEVYFRTMYFGGGGRTNRPHRRVDEVIWEGRQLYKAPGL